jgi:hypothetical protein
MCGEKMAQHANIKISSQLSVKYGGGSIMVWGCFAASAWTACYHRQKNEFPSLSRNFTGECKAICPSIEAQQFCVDYSNSPTTFTNQSN